MANRVDGPSALKRISILITIACINNKNSITHSSVASHGLDSDEAACEISVPQLPLEILFQPPLPDDGPLLVEATSEIGIVLVNDSELPGVATIAAYSLSHVKEDWVAVSTQDISGNATVELSVPVETLGLTSVQLEFSGSVMLGATIEYSNGNTSATRPLRFFFHPTESGWAFYNAAVRDSEFASGAITAYAVALREEAIASADSPVGEIGMALVEHVSDDIVVPLSDGPADNNGAVD